MAERELRRDEELVVETADTDGDGHDELWIHGPLISCVVSPRRGGAVEELTLLDRAVNVADVLTRRPEAYHEIAPPRDSEDRALLVVRVLPDGLAREAYARGEYRPVHSWAATPLEPTVTVASTGVEIVLRDAGATTGLREMRVLVAATGTLRVDCQWDPARFPGDAWFAPELSVSLAPVLRCEPEADLWSYPIATTAKSERGLEETVQGTALIPRWPVALGRGSCELTWPAGAPGLPRATQTV